MGCCGSNLNVAMSYKTPKYVEIRDWRLGAIQQLITLLIVLRIVAMDVVYHGNHLKPYDVHGIVRATMQQPTQGGCNPARPDCYSDFRPMTQLPYCTQNASDTPEGVRRLSEENGTHHSHAENETHGSHVATHSHNATLRGNATREGNGTRAGNATHAKPVPTRRERCAYWDAVKMGHASPALLGGLFVPTRVQKIRQERGCTPSKSNDWSCDSKLFMDRASNASEEDPPFFIADVERFTVLINNAFHIMDEVGLAGKAADFDAVLDPNRKTSDQNVEGHLLHRTRDEDGKVKEVDKVLVPKEVDDASPFPSAQSTEMGDVLSIGDLVRAADPRGVKLLDAERVNQSTIRWDGAVVDVTITYTNKANFDPLGRTEPHYVISANFAKIGEYKVMYGHESDGGRHRDLYDVHGIFFTFHVQGEIRRFSLAHLLSVLTTAMVSLAMASTLTDWLMMNLMHFKDKYKIIKYQPTVDFGVFRDRMSRLQDHYQHLYDPADHKPMAHADILNDLAEKNLAPEGESLLLILLKFEQRLNRLDGLDEFNACPQDVADERKDKGAKALRRMEGAYKFSGILSHRDRFAE